ncbi:MAG: hypothetical protein ACK5L3_10295, partial [Oscillospiraceae bacterium]
EKNILQRYYRNLGDVLLEKGYINTAALNTALAEARQSKQRLGAVLKANYLISDEQLLRGLANIKHSVFLPSLEGFPPLPVLLQHSRDFWEQAGAFPLLQTADGYVAALSDESPPNAEEALQPVLGGSLHIVYATSAEIQTALQQAFHRHKAPGNAYALIFNAFYAAYLSYEQALLCCIYLLRKPGTSARHAFTYMGFANILPLMATAPSAAPVPAPAFLQSTAYAPTAQPPAR